MKIILNILIIVQFCACDDSPIYNWNVKTIERDSDLKKDLDEQTNFNNDIQLSDSARNNYGTRTYDKSFYKKFNNKYAWNTDDVDINKNFVYNEESSDPFNKKTFTKNENRNMGLKRNFITLQNNRDVNRKENIDNNRHYTGTNYGNNKWYGVFSKNNKHKEQKIYRPYYNIPYDEDDERLQMSNIDQYEDSRSHFLPFSLYRNKYNNSKSNIDNNHTENITLISQCSGKYEEIESFVGTNLIDNTVKRCFSTEDVALLATRRDFENLIPKDLPQCLFSDRMVQVLLKYFHMCRQIITETSSDSLLQLTLKAFYDTLGGYLNYYMVPVAKYSYYAGHISLNTAQQVLILYQQCKTILNTNGNGWKTPIQNVLIELKSVQIEPLNIPQLNGDKFNEPSFCMHLDMVTEEYQPHDDKMIVQIPKLEAEDLNGSLSNVWLPFRRKKIYNLKADSSAYIIVQFYETVTKCYRYENIDQTYYNNQFKSWLLESIHIHLSDEQFYPGLGAVLRIYEYLKRIKKDTKTNKANVSVSKIKSAKQNNKFDNSKTFNNNENILIDSDLLHINEKNQNPSNIRKNSNTNQRNNSISKGILSQKDIKTTIDGSELMAEDNEESTSNKIKLGNIALTPAQIAITAIPTVAIILIILICCYKSFCRKKKPEVKTKKNSSSSSSNLFNSPVRFFHVRPKSVSDYSSNEVGGKKNKKTVKIKKSSLTSDTSASSSPVRNKSKGKFKDSSKK